MTETQLTPDPVVEAATAETRAALDNPNAQVVGFVIGSDENAKFVERNAFNDLQKATVREKALGNLSKSSKQIPTDVFRLSYETQGNMAVVKPPYNLDELLYMREIHPTHGAALHQKTADIVGGGWEWRPKRLPKPKDADPEGADQSGDVVEDPDSPGYSDTSLAATGKGSSAPDESELEAANAFLEAPNEEGDCWEEVFDALVSDKWTLANAFMEIVRSVPGVVDSAVKEIYHVPGHTVRVHRDGDKFLQYRSGKFVWFKKWREERHLDCNSGKWFDDPLPDDIEANEMIQFKKKTSRSSWYGIPEYVSCVSSLATGVSLLEYNRSFFNRYAVPSWAVVVEGSDLSPQLRSTLEQYFRTEVRGNPHRVLTIGIPYIPTRPSGDNRIKVTFVRLSDQVKDMSFRHLSESVNLDICMSHRIPPQRIGWPVPGQGTGNAQSAQQLSQNYKTGVIDPEQNIWTKKLSAFFALEFGVKNFWFQVTELDIVDKLQNMMYATQGVKGSIMRINEARHIAGLPPDPDGDVILVPGGYGTLDILGIQVLAPAATPPGATPAGGGGQGAADNPFGQNGNNGQPDAPPSPKQVQNGGVTGKGKTLGPDMRRASLRPIQRRREPNYIEQLTTMRDQINSILQDLVANGALHN